MKLYRIRIDPTGKSNWCRETYFRTSAVKAKQVASKFKGRRVEIDECQVRDRLTAENWIALLEFDSPGSAEGLTPVDFIESSQTIWTNRRKKAAA